MSGATADIGEVAPVEAFVTMVRFWSASGQSPELGCLARFERPGRGNWLPEGLNVSSVRRWPFAATRLQVCEGTVRLCIFTAPRAKNAKRR